MIGYFIPNISVIAVLNMNPPTPKSFPLHALAWREAIKGRGNEIYSPPPMPSPVKGHGEKGPNSFLRNPGLIRLSLFLEHLHQILFIILPAEGFPPPVREVKDLSRFFGSDKNLQGILQDSHLGLYVMRLAALVPQRKIHEDRSRGFHPSHHVPTGSDINGGNPALLDSPGYQSHGLMVQRSGGHQ
jgi:hypothetical protein